MIFSQVANALQSAASDGILTTSDGILDENYILIESTDRATQDNINANIYRWAFDPTNRGIKTQNFSQSYVFIDSVNPSTGIQIVATSATARSAAAGTQTQMSQKVEVADGASVTIHVTSELATGGGWGIAYSYDGAEPAAGDTFTWYTELLNDENHVFTNSFGKTVWMVIQPFNLTKNPAVYSTDKQSYTMAVAHSGSLNYRVTQLEYQLVASLNTIKELQDKINILETKLHT